MTVTVKEASSRREIKQFVHFPNQLYEHNPYYVPTLESADRALLNPKKNHAFEFCEGKYWLALGEDGKIVGRIAGIINRQYNRKTGTDYARFGFMDFIDDDSVVDALLDTVEKWAHDKGMNVMNGPLGFLEFDAAGVLVEGYEELPTAYGKYNFPYYETQLLRRGYSKDTDWVEMRSTLPDDIGTCFRSIAERLCQRYGLHQADIRNKRKMKAYFDECIDVLNEAYGRLHGFSELTKAQVDDLKKQFVPNLNREFVSVVLDENDKVVAFGVAMPSLSKAMQKCKGHLFPFGFLHILHALKHNDTIDTLLIAVRDEYRLRGVNAIIFEKLSTAAAKYGIRYMESTRQLEDNLNVQNMWNRFENRLNKRARCYVKNQ